MATVLDVITGAMQRIGTLDAIEVPTAADAALGLRCLNLKINTWALDGLQSYTRTRTTFTITSGTQDYSVGAGQVVNIARPSLNNLDTVHFQDTSVSPTLEYQLTQLTEDAWANLPQRTQTAPLPTYWYFNPTYPYGTLSFFQVPTSSTLQGVVYVSTAVPEFSAVTDTILLPPGYQLMYETALALELLQFYPERQSVPGLPEAALAAEKAVKRGNIRPVDLSVDAGAIVQGPNTSFVYNILTGP